ncbi:MAG: hypothetical protein MUF87_10280 [Anaerolineae bacterium]|nr:hypothetical protein [Anaerolineae bacterium]
MLDPMSMSQNGYNLIHEDGQAMLTARREFTRMIGAGRSKKLQAMLTMRSRRLESLTQERGYVTAQRHGGLQVISINAITGSENRADEFDREFYPMADHLEMRWARVAIAHLRGIKLPPIEVIRVGERYYVRDGHHRVSVARAFGIEDIDAVVIAYDTPREC